MVQNTADTPDGWDAISRTGADDPLDAVRGGDPEFLPGAGERGLDDLVGDR